MSGIENLIKSISARPSVIVHLGAGSCSEHGTYNSFNPDRVIYVEPDPTLANSAIDRFDNNPQVEIVQCAIATESSRQKLNITNNRRFNSLLLPGELLNLYPNIEVHTQIEVDTITLEQLCNDAKINNNPSILLVAELPGMEREVISATATKTLQKFKWMIIRTSKSSLYGPASENVSHDLSRTMHDAGFSVLVFEDESPPFLDVLCLRNDAILEIGEFRSRETKLLHSIHSLESDITDQAAKINGLKAQHAKKLNLQSSELKKITAELRTVIAAEKKQHSQILDLFSAVESKSAELETALALKKSLHEEKTVLQLQNSNLSSKLDVKSADLNTAHSNLRSLELENKTLKQQIDRLSGSLDAKKKEIKLEVQSLTDSLKEKENELTDMQQTMRINSKLVLKSDADLRDLQLQYRSSLQHQEQQHSLLCDLKDKLRQASEYYSRLNLQSLVLDSEKLEQVKSDTLDPDSNN